MEVPPEKEDIKKSEVNVDVEAGSKPADAGSIKTGAISTVLNASNVEELKIPGLDPVFEAKADLVNHAIQAMGMGRYQWWLFIVTGFGWFVDQVSFAPEIKLQPSMKY